MLTAFRVLALVLGCMCLYMSLFMYRDERGELKDRIHNFWLTIYERAKQTDGTTTALFNKLAELIRRWFDKLFSHFDINVTTLLYGLIPVGLLILVLVNRVIWPVLSRLLYPIANRAVMMDNKFMASMGGLFLTFAFNLEKVGYKEVLKLFAG